MAKIGRKRGGHTVWVDGGTTSGGGGGGTTLQSNRVAEWLFTENSGQRVFNRAGSNTSNNNLIGMSEGHWKNVANYFSNYFLSSETTITENAANNENGKMTAARIETLSGSTVNGGTGAYAGMRIQGRDFSAGTYTLSLSVKSNTGSAQTMRMACTNSGPISGDLNVTTSWTRVSWTFSHPGGTQLIYFAINGSGGSPMDILIDKIKLETGSSATAYVTPNFDLTFGIDAASESVDPTWVSGKGIALDSQYALGFNVENPVSTTNISLHIVAKMNSSFTEQGYILNTAFGDGGFELRFGVGRTSDTTIKPAVKWSGTQISAKILKLADDQVHHVCATYDGTTLNFYVDKILFATATVSLSAATIRRLQLGYGDLVGAIHFKGEVYYASVYNAAHNTTDIATQYSALASIMTGRGVTMAPNNIFIMAEGDSITANPGNYPRKGIMSITTANLAENKAVVGDVVANLVAREAVIDTYYDAGRSKNILSVLIGANDMSGATSAATFVANLKSYCLARKAVGWKVLVCTVLPNTNSGFNTKRNTANGLIVADNSFYDALCRFDLNANMGNDADASDTSKYSDGVHPTDAGYNFLYADWATAVATLF